MSTAGRKREDNLRSPSLDEVLMDTRTRWGDDPRSGGVSQSGSVLSSPGNMTRNNNRMMEPESYQVVKQTTSLGRSSYENAAGMPPSGEHPQSALSSEATSSQPSRTRGRHPAPSRPTDAPDDAYGRLQTTAGGRGAGQLDLAPSTLQSAAQVSPRKQPRTLVCDPY
jgi:hypothetical protein